MLTTIPFCGFYETVHDHYLDQAFEGMLADDSGCPREALISKPWEFVYYKNARAKYAKAYAENFATLIGAKIAFSAMRSPREYNFTTDVITCEISLAEIRRVIRTLPVGAVQAKVRDTFTSRSGFISFYSPDVSEWGPVSAWDQNQCGAVLACLADVHAHGEKWDSEDESGLMEYITGTGHLDNWIIEGSKPEFLRIVNINDYLNKRAARG